MKPRKPIARLTPLRPTRCPECLKGRRKCAEHRKTGAGLRGKGPRKPLKAVNKERRAKNFERSYGGLAHIRWMQGQACSACTMSGPCEVSHVRSGGMGRKADARHTVPHCASCHRAYHRIGRESFQRQARVDLDAQAAEWWERWLQHSEGYGA